MAATVYRIHREYIDIEYGYVIWIVDLFLVVIYRRYIAQCGLKSVGFTTSRIKESSEIKKKTPAGHNHALRYRLSEYIIIWIGTRCMELG